MSTALRINCCCSGCCRACVRDKCYAVTFGGTFTLNTTWFSPPDLLLRPPTTEQIISGAPIDTITCQKVTNVMSENGVDLMRVSLLFFIDGSGFCHMQVLATTQFGNRVQFFLDDIVSGINCGTFDVTGVNETNSSDSNTYYTGGTIRVRVVDCNCTACPSSITAVVSGFTGACATYLNATYTLDRNGTLCEWVDNGSPVKVRLEKGGNNGYLVRLTASDGTIGTSTKINQTSSDCPVNGTYTVTFSGGGACSFQTGTIVIS